MSSGRVQALSRIRRYFENLRERVKGRSEVTPVIEIQTILVRPMTDVVPTRDLSRDEVCTSIVVEQPFTIDIGNDDRVSHQEDNGVHHRVHNQMFSHVRQFADGLRQRQTSRPPETTRICERRSIPMSDDSPSPDVTDLVEVVVVDPPCATEVNSEERVSQEEENDDLLCAYHDILYKCGICLVGPGEMQQPNKLQLVKFWTVLLAALLYTVTLVKHYCFVSKMSVEELSIAVAYNLILILLKSAWAFTSISRRNETKAHLKKSKDARHLFPNSYGKKKKTKVTIGLILGIALVYSCVCLVQSDLEWQHWTPELILEWRAYNMGRFAFVWTRNVTNETENFLDSFTDDINPTSASLGLLSLFFEFNALNHLQLIMGAFLIHSLSLNNKAEEFGEWLSNPDSMVGAKMAEKTWKMYIHLKEESERTNFIYGVVFSFFHPANILLGAFFFYECTHFSVRRGSMFYLMCNVARAVLFYSVNAKPHETNGTFQSWNRKNFRNKTVVEIENYESITVAMLMDELNTSPIGLRINSIPIGPAMLAELVASALTYFIVLLTAH